MRKEEFYRIDGMYLLTPIGKRGISTGLTGFYRINRIILEWQGMDSIQRPLNHPKIILLIL